GLENLERAGQIKDSLRSRADDGNSCSSELRQVRRDVETIFAAAMNTADAPGRKDRDSRARRREHRSGDCGGAWNAGCDDGGKIGGTDFGDAVAVSKECELLIRESDDDFAAENTDCGRNRAGLPDGGFHFASRLKILRPGKALSDHGGFQCNDW